MDEKKIPVDRQSLLARIKAGDPKTMRVLYKDFRQAFVAWAVQSYRCAEEEAVELFQQSFTILYLNIRNDKLTVLTSSLKTYLISIGRNLFRQRSRIVVRETVGVEEAQELPYLLDTSLLDDYRHRHQKEMVRQLLNSIGDPCKTLLDMAFIKEFSADAIAHQMGYADEGAVRKRKSLCLKKMREMLADRPFLI